jgi:hypothetical protein
VQVSLKQVSLNIVVPISVVNIFYGWVMGLGSQYKSLVLVRVTVLCWELWTSRNDIVFDNSSIKTYMQVLYRGMYWLCQWAQLQRHEDLTK